MPFLILGWVWFYFVGVVMLRYSLSFSHITEKEVDDLLNEYLYSVSLEGGGTGEDHCSTRSVVSIPLLAGLLFPFGLSQRPLF